MALQNFFHKKSGLMNIKPLGKGYCRISAN